MTRKYISIGRASIGELNIVEAVNEGTEASAGLALGLEARREKGINIEIATIESTKAGIGLLWGWCSRSQVDECTAVGGIIIVVRVIACCFVIGDRRVDGL